MEKAVGVLDEESDDEEPTLVAKPHCRSRLELGYSLLGRDTKVKTTCTPVPGIVRNLKTWRRLERLEEIARSVELCHGLLAELEGATKP